jgi:NAD(P)-dependent dehydrogenase (short-subunit alcohol dehydrogenase family)
MAAHGGAAVRVAGSTALVTGANRGLGRAYVQALLDAGAAKVYAGVRDANAPVAAGSIPIRLDVTDPATVAQAADSCGDVTLLVNNAGTLHRMSFLAAPSMDAARSEMETNYFGTLAMCRAFAAVLGRNGGGAVVNMLSVVSWFTYPLSGTQSASKAAALSLTDGLRIELRGQGTLVAGVFAGFIDTDMARGIDAPKSAPLAIARRVIEGIERGEEEILADERSLVVREAIRQNPAVIRADMQKLWDAAHNADRRGRA